MAGDYLRIVTPVRNKFGGPALDARGVIMTKEINAPLSARKNFEQENADLERFGRPELKHKIFVVHAEPEPTGKPIIAPALPNDRKPAQEIRK